MILRTGTAILTLAAATALPSAGPALAQQVYPAPGFPSSHASCAGAGVDFQAHYAGEDSTFPIITHGTVGPAVSDDATSLPAGSVGAFQSTLARTSGPIGECVP